MHVKVKDKAGRSRRAVGSRRAALVVCCVFGWTLSLGGVAQASFTKARHLCSSGSSATGNSPRGWVWRWISSAVTSTSPTSQTTGSRSSNRLGTYLSQFAAPGAAGAAVDPECGGDIYVTDLIGNVVNQYSASGSLPATFGSSGSGNGQFNEPVAVAVDPTSGDLYVAEAGNHRVQKLSCSGAYSCRSLPT